MNDPERTYAAGQAYLRWGWRPIPLHWPIGAGTDAVRCSCEAGADCRNAGKHPLIGGWPHVNRSGGDLLRWLDCWPQMNLGMVTGAPSSVAVIDVDPRHGGDESLAKLQGGGELLPTTTATTGGGGQHLLHQHPGHKVTSNARALGPDFPGLDVRGDGGLIVAAPSLHASGKRYRWTDARPPAPWPAVLDKLLTPPKQEPPQADRAVWHGSGREALIGIARVLHGKPEGERNHALYWAGRAAARHVMAGRLPEALARDVLERTAEQIGLDDQKQNKATLNSAWGAEAREH